MSRPIQYQTLEDHLNEYLPDRPEGGCWPWRGALNYAGYGVLTDGGKQWRAHRAAYAVWVDSAEPSPLDHRCHTESDCEGGADCPHRRCCNPAHLRPLGNIENVMVGMSSAAKNARKTLCSRGHEFDGTRITPAGNIGRKCRTCQREDQAAWRAKHRDEINRRRRERRAAQK